MSWLWPDKDVDTLSIINSLDPCLWPIQPFRDYLQCFPKVQLKECYGQPSMTLATMSACLHIVSLLAFGYMLYRRKKGIGAEVAKEKPAPRQRNQQTLRANPGHLAKYEKEKQTKEMKQMAEDIEKKDRIILSQEGTIKNKDICIGDLSKRVHDVNEEMKKLEKEKERLQENVKPLQKENAEKLKELKKLQDELVVIKTELIDEKGKNRTKMTATLTATVVKPSKDDEKEELRQKNQQLADECNKLGDKIKDLETEQVDRNKECVNLKNDIAQKESEMKEMRRHNQKLESDNNVLRTENEGLKKSVKVLEDQLVEKEKELDENQTEIKRKVKKIEGLEKKIDDIRDATMNWLYDNIPDEYVIPQSAHEDERITPILSQLMHRVNKEKDGDPLNPVPLAGPEIDLDMGSPVILPCVAASRVGSDINAALSKAKIGKSQVILIIFHHLAPHNCKISTATEDRLSDRTILDQCVAIVDAVFWNGAMYECAANTKAVDKIQRVLRWTVMLEDLMHLRRIVKESN